MNAKNNAATVAGGVVSGVLGLLLILAAAFCFLRIRRRRTRNVVDVVYSPIEPSGSPSDVEGQTRQLPPIRTITPLAWPIDLSRPPHLPETSARDADNAGPSRPVEIVSNPFEPVAFTSSSHKLVDVASVKSSRSLHSDDGNPFEDGANQYWSRDSGDSSLDAAYPESEMLHIDGGLGRSSSTTVTEQRAQIDHEQKAQVDHARHLSMTSDCPYPVLEPDSQERPRHLSVKSMKSGLSYATLDPDWVKRMQDQHLSRTSSASTSSSVVNVSNTITFSKSVLIHYQFLDGLRYLRTLQTLYITWFDGLLNLCSVLEHLFCSGSSVAWLSSMKQHHRTLISIELLLTDTARVYCLGNTIPESHPQGTNYDFFFARTYIIAASARMPRHEPAALHPPSFFVLS